LNNEPSHQPSSTASLRSESCWYSQLASLDFSIQAAKQLLVCVVVPFIFLPHAFVCHNGLSPSGSLPRSNLCPAPGLSPIPSAGSCAVLKQTSSSIWLEVPRVGVFAAAPLACCTLIPLLPSNITDSPSLVSRRRELAYSAKKTICIDVCVPGRPFFFLVSSFASAAYARRIPGVWLRVGSATLASCVPQDRLSIVIILSRPHTDYGSAVKYVGRTGCVCVRSTWLCPADPVRTVCGGLPRTCSIVASTAGFLVPGAPDIGSLMQQKQVRGALAQAFLN
jgi:hypothetical protein